VKRRERVRSAVAWRLVAPPRESPSPEGCENVKAADDASRIGESELAARDSIYQIAFQEAVRALDAQRNALNELRGRAAILLSAASVAASLVGGQAALHSVNLGTWLGIACFIAGLLSTLILLVWPIRLRSETATTILIDEYADREARLAYRDLALFMDDALSQNQAGIGTLYRVLAGGAILIGAAVVIWLIDLGIAGGGSAPA
jgi:hypothetical protein